MQSQSSGLKSCAWNHEFGPEYRGRKFLRNVSNKSKLNAVEIHNSGVKINTDLFENPDISMETVGAACRNHSIYESPKKLFNTENKAKRYWTTKKSMKQAFSLVHEVKNTDIMPIRCCVIKVVGKPSLNKPRHRYCRSA
jgi:putative lipase involved disintegration of autophagic bodies